MGNRHQSLKSHHGCGATGSGGLLNTEMDPELMQESPSLINRQTINAIVKK